MPAGFRASLQGHALPVRLLFMARQQNASPVCCPATLGRRSEVCFGVAGPAGHTQGDMVAGCNRDVRGVSQSLPSAASAAMKSGARPMLRWGPGRWIPGASLILATSDPNVDLFCRSRRIRPQTAVKATITCALRGAAFPLVQQAAWVHLDVETQTYTPTVFFNDFWLLRDHMTPVRPVQFNGPCLHKSWRGGGGTSCPCVVW